MLFRRTKGKQKGELLQIHRKLRGKTHANKTTKPPNSRTHQKNTNQTTAQRPPKNRPPTSKNLPHQVKPRKNNSPQKKKNHPKPPFVHRLNQPNPLPNKNPTPKKHQQNPPNPPITHSTKTRLPPNLRRNETAEGQMPLKEPDSGRRCPTKKNEEDAGTIR